MSLIAKWYFSLMDKKKCSNDGPWFIENTYITVNVNMNSNHTSDL